MVGSINHSFNILIYVYFLSYLFHRFWSATRTNTKTLFRITSSHIRSLSFELLVGSKVLLGAKVAVGEKVSVGENVSVGKKVGNVVVGKNVMDG